MSRSKVVNFACPRCTRTSYNPTDVRLGYCAACDAFTDPERSKVPCTNGECGKRVQVVRRGGALYEDHDTLRGLRCQASGTPIPP